MADEASERRTEPGALRHKNRWWHVLLVGLLFNVLYILVYLATDNDNLLPTILALGTFLVPVTFAVFLVDRLPPGVVPFGVLAWCAFWSGMINLPLTALIPTGPYNLLVGPIEESAKLLVPLWFYFRTRYRSEAAGLLIGFSAGLGFAVLESLGFNLAAALYAEDDFLGSLEQTLFVRGLLSPFGHMPWTAIICAVLWRERERAGRATFNLKVLGTFAVVALLHTVYDLGEILLPDSILLELGFMLPIGIVTLVLFFLLLRESRRELEASATSAGGGGGVPAAPSVSEEGPLPRPPG